VTTNELFKNVRYPIITSHAISLHLERVGGSGSNSEVMLNSVESSSEVLSFQVGVVIFSVVVWHIRSVRYCMSALEG
jgi:hypothetical protein